jgi:hypothetical protein
MKYLPLFLIFLFHLSGHAQRKAALPYKEKWTVRFSPLGLVDVFDGNLSAGATLSLNKRWLLSADLSYIFYSVYLDKDKGVSGYIFKPGVRYYFSDRRRFFIESGAFYKRVGYRVNDWLGKDAVNGVPAYQEWTTFTFRKQVLGINVMAGVQKSLVKSNRLRMEIYAGTGLRYKWQDIKHEPRASYRPDVLLTNKFYLPAVLGASIPHGLRLVYVIE